MARTIEVKELFSFYKKVLYRIILLGSIFYLILIEWALTKHDEATFHKKTVGISFVH